MTGKIYLFILVLSLTLITACTTSQASSENRQEVVIDDGSNLQNKDEITITDADLNRTDLLDTAAGKDSRKQTVSVGDKSKITTTVDSYGNKTETRCFVNHPRLDCVVVITSAKGKKQTLIYPVGSGAKILPENSNGTALTASPDELANLAGVYETRTDVAKKSVSPYGRKKDENTFRPLPSSEFPVFPRQIEQPPVEQTEEEQVEESDLKAAKEAETAASKPELEEEK